jgi:hypothetical protein
MVKRGLVIDPKHREALGVSIWLYLFILDRADWQQGAVIEWRDKAEAEEMGMPVPTLRWQRKKLEDAGYIRCERKGNKQRLVVLKWVNPREYTGKVYNAVPTIDDTREEGVTTRVTTRVTSEMGKPEGALKELNHLVTDSPKTLAPKNGRPHDALFDAIAKTCQVDPATTGPSVGKVRAGLVKALPPYTVAEVEAFGRWWWGDKGMRQRPPTVWQLLEQIGVVRQQKPGTRLTDKEYGERLRAGTLPVEPEPFIPPSMRA